MLLTKIFSGWGGDTDLYRQLFTNLLLGEEAGVDHVLLVLVHAGEPAEKLSPKQQRKLARILAKPGLSSDVYEIASKSLE